MMCIFKWLFRSKSEKKSFFFLPILIIRFYNEYNLSKGEQSEHCTLFLDLSST